MTYELHQNVRLGLFFGLALATLYSLWAIALFLLDGSRAFAKNDTTIAGVLLAYYAAGIIGGAAVGAMLPLGRSLPGRIAIGLVAALVFFACVLTAMEGPAWDWTRATWETLAIAAAFFGTVCSVLWRRFTGL